MSSLNKVQLIARLGKDPELKTVGQNQVANFSVATSETWKDKSSGEKKEKTTWHNIVIWGALANVAGQYLHKGDQVYLEGKIDTRSYEKDGSTRYVTEIIVSNMVMLGGKSSGSAPASNQGEAAWDPTPTTGGGQPVTNTATNNNNFDELPF